MNCYRPKSVSYTLRQDAGLCPVNWCNIGAEYKRDTLAAVWPKHDEERRKQRLSPGAWPTPASTATPADLAARPTIRCTPGDTWPSGSRDACPPQRYEVPEL